MCFLDMEIVGWLWKWGWRIELDGGEVGDPGENDHPVKTFKDKKLGIINQYLDKYVIIKN